MCVEKLWRSVRVLEICGGVCVGNAPKTKLERGISESWDGN